MATALHLSPHPDDELLGAPAALFALRDAGFRIVNLAVSLGRPDQRQRRLGELHEACERAGFELRLPQPLPAIGSGDDLKLAERQLTQIIGEAIGDLSPQVVISPSPHDRHHGHEVVARAAMNALAAAAKAPRWWLWGLWGELPLPNLAVCFDEERLAQIEWALAAHAGEIERNDYQTLLRARAQANAVLGAERVFGFGSPSLATPYLESLTDVQVREDGWFALPPRLLDPEAPLAGGDAAGTEISFWLYQESVTSALARGR